jgi:rubrerythrin
LKKMVEKIDLCSTLIEGVAKEKESRDFYALHARNAKQKDLRALFEMLALEEEGHERVLEAMLKGKTCPLGKQASLATKTPKIEESFARSEDAGEFSTTLLVAMSFEQKSREFYETLALATEKSGDEENKKVFASLASFEQRHYDLLNEMYEELNYFRLQT